MMLPLDWLRQLRQRLFRLRPTTTGRRRPPSPPSPRRSLRPRLESLEDRITPTTFAPTLFSDGVSGGAVQTLRDAVLAANNDSGTATDTIQLAAGTYTLSIPNTANNHDVSGTQGDLNITSTSHALVIQGVTDASGKPTTIINQTVADRVFQIVNAGSIVTFKNVIIQGGNAQDDGSAGATSGSTAALGGGILDDGGNVTLSNVVLQSNKAQAGSSLSAEEAGGGGIYAQNGSLTITNSVIQNNHADGGNGTITILKGGNGLGGGVGFTASGSSQLLRITSSTVANNTALGGTGYSVGDGTGGLASGGGIDASSSGGSTFAVITASLLTGNKAIGGDASGNGNLQAASGGGASFNGSVTLVNSTIAGNEAIAGNGKIPPSLPYVAFGGGAVFGGGTATLTNVTVAGNKSVTSQGGSANTASGGIDNFSSPATVKLTNTLVALNSAATGPDYYGAVSNSDHNLIGNADGSSGFSAAHGDLLGTTANPLNPQLGPLANNGGPTLTLALLPGSPAIAKGDPNVQSATGPYDQRGPGFARAAKGIIDIGAYEYTQPSTPSGGGGGTTTPPSLFQALIALYIDGIYFEIDSLLNQATTAVQADIDHYLPYAGPFGALFELAGRIAVLQALQHG